MDVKAFTDRARAAEAKLFRVAYGVLRCEADCKDALQEALLKAWRKQGSLRDEALFDTWLTRILINECYMLIRKNKRVVAVSPPEKPPENGQLHDALMGLPDKLRIPLTLHYTEGYTTGEIARILRMPEGTVKGRLVRGRAALKNEMTSEVWN